MVQATIIQLLAAGWTPTAISTVEGTQPIVASDQIAQYLRRYGSRVYNAYTDDELSGVGAPVDQIAADWDMHIAIHHADYIRMYNALIEDYRPLDNYNMIESGSTSNEINRTYSREHEDTTDDTGTTTTATDNTRTLNTTDTVARTGTDKTGRTTADKTVDGSTVTTTNTGTQTNAGTGNTTNAVSAYDVSTYSNTDKSDTTNNSTRTDDLTATTTNGGEINVTGTGSDTVTHDTTDITTNEGTVTDGGKEDYTRALKSITSGTISDTEGTTDKGAHTLTRSGNIGVTTSQQMLISEIELRAKNNFLAYVVAVFVAQYTTW